MDGTHEENLDNPIKQCNLVWAPRCVHPLILGSDCELDFGDVRIWQEKKAVLNICHQFDVTRVYRVYKSISRMTNRRRRTPRCCHQKDRYRYSWIVRFTSWKYLRQMLEILCLYGASARAVNQRDYTPGVITHEIRSGVSEDFYENPFYTNWGGNKVWTRRDLKFITEIVQRSQGKELSEEGLQGALESHYAATWAPDPGIAIFLDYAALDSLTPSTDTVSKHFLQGKSKKTSFHKFFINNISDMYPNIPANIIEKMYSMVLNTNVDKRNKYILDMMHECDIYPDENSRKEVVDIRNRAAHGNLSGKENWQEELARKMSNSTTRVLQRKLEEFLDMPKFQPDKNCGSWLRVGWM